MIKKMSIFGDVQTCSVGLLPKFGITKTIVMPSDKKYIFSFITLRMKAALGEIKEGRREGGKEGRREEGKKGRREEGKERDGGNGKNEQ